MARDKTKARHDERHDAAPAPKNIVLRQAGPRDVSFLYEVLIRYFDELRFAYPVPVEAPTLAWGLAVIITGAVFIAVCDGRIIGSVGLEWGQFPWNPSVKYLNAVWYYVAPEFRGGSTAFKLCKMAKDTACQNGVGLRMDSVWGVKPERQATFRERLGFHYVGSNHVWFPSAKGDSDG